MTISQTGIDDITEEYLLRSSQFENKDIDFVFNSAYKYDEPYMQISKLQASTLQSFIKMENIKFIFEVGTFVGFSSFAMAKSFTDSNSRLISIEIDEKFHQQAIQNQMQYVKLHQNPIDSIHRINLVLADAKEYLSTTKDDLSDVDFFFLDGDKINYTYYYEWAVRNLKSGGYFVVDNALFKGKVASGSNNQYAVSIRSVTERIRDDGFFDYYYLPVGDCMIIAKKR